MHTILEVVVGSTLHGTAVSDGLEDLDLMGIVVEKAPQFVGFNTVDTWVTRTKPEGVRSEAGDVDHTAYGLRKYLTLALKGNPTILLALFAPPEFVRMQTDEGRQLQALASSIISKQVYEPFKGYMHQQYERLIDVRGQKNVTRPELIERHGFDTKYAAHIIRLGYQGAELLRTGRVSLPMPQQQRAHVLKVRTGAYTLDNVATQIKLVQASLEFAYNDSTLPEHPDRAKVEHWMVDTYLRYWHRGE